VFGSTAFAGGLDPNLQIGAQLKTQILAALYTAVLSGVVSYVLLKLIGATLGLRVSADDEATGLDQTEHGEEAYND
jgi:ammonium transporter, Amt family